VPLKADRDARTTVLGALRRRLEQSQHPQAAQAVGERPAAPRDRVGELFDQLVWFASTLKAARQKST